MSRFLALLATGLFFLTQSLTATAQSAAGTWSTGKKTYSPGDASPGSMMDLAGGPDKWTLTASSVVNTPTGNEVTNIVFYFGTVGMPPAGRYRIVGIGEPFNKSTVSVVATFYEGGADPYTYSCTGAGEHYVVVSAKDGHAVLKMDAAPAIDNTMEQTTTLSADLVQTDEATD